MLVKVLAPKWIYKLIKKKGKKIMVTMLILAIVAITVAQAVSMGKKIDMK